MDALKDEVRAWLEHETYMQPVSDADDPYGEKQNYRISIQEGVIAPPEQPEPLQILYRTRRFGLPLWTGGYADQPHILLMELNACIDEEIAFHNLQVFNKERQDATQGPQGQSIDSIQ